MQPDELRLVIRAVYPEEGEEEIDEMMEALEAVQLCRKATGVSLEDLQRPVADVELRKKPQ